MGPKRMQSWRRMLLYKWVIHNQAVNTSRDILVVDVWLHSGTLEGYSGLTTVVRKTFVWWSIWEWLSISIWYAVKTKTAQWGLSCSLKKNRIYFYFFYPTRNGRKTLIFRHIDISLLPADGDKVQSTIFCIITRQHPQSDSVLFLPCLKERWIPQTMIKSFFYYYYILYFIIIHSDVKDLSFQIGMKKKQIL